MQPKSLQQTISILSSCVGKLLRSAEYRCFPSECGETEVAAPLFAMGGEVCLHFETCAPSYVTWVHDHTADWKGHYVIAVFPRSAFDEGALEPVDVSNTPIWGPLINTELQSVQIGSWTDAPSILRFTFGGGGVYVCSGIQWHPPGVISDGDSVLVRSEAEFHTYNGGYPPFCLLVSLPDYREVGP